MYYICEKIFTQMKENADYSVQRCDDGKYRWRYELDMWKNPSILILIFKIFFWVFVGIWGFMIILTLIEDGWNLERIWDTSLPFLILIGAFTVIALIAYAIVAAMYGGKYIVLFEMDEKGVNHCQINAQAMRARKLGIITAAAGVACCSRCCHRQSHHCWHRCHICFTLFHVHLLRQREKRSMSQASQPHQGERALFQESSVCA